MLVNEFISEYKNHPVLFIGTGISLRYLKRSFTWDQLLSHIASELKSNEEFYLDIKSKCECDGQFDYAKIATALEHEFNTELEKDRNGKFKKVNDAFYAAMQNNINLSRLKIFIASLLEGIGLREEMAEEIAEFTKVRKNVGSVITTNYDKLIEQVFAFQPLIGNDILLSNPYGSVYKVHGCISDPARIIITEQDYSKFNDKYELIRAQLLSIFIHNPIIFIGYRVGDENIKGLLQTVFTYVEPNSEDAERIRSNFLLVERDEGSSNRVICEHDIVLENGSTIRINKIKTDDFSEIYRCLAALSLPVSAMDVRKVQNVVREIYQGGSIQVKITEDLDSVSNDRKIIAIGTERTIRYEYQTSAEIMANYFEIMDESNYQLLELIDKLTIQITQWFPAFGFGSICDTVTKMPSLQEQQLRKLGCAMQTTIGTSESDCSTIQGILNDTAVTQSRKFDAITRSIWENKIELSDAESYLRKFNGKKDTSYRRMLCAYDVRKYGGPDVCAVSRR